MAVNNISDTKVPTTRVEDENYLYDCEDGVSSDLEVSETVVESEDSFSMVNPTVSELLRPIAPAQTSILSNFTLESSAIDSALTTDPEDGVCTTDDADGDGNIDNSEFGFSTVGDVQKQSGVIAEGPLSAGITMTPQVSPQQAQTKTKGAAAKSEVVENPQVAKQTSPQSSTSASGFNSGLLAYDSEGNLTYTLQKGDTLYALAQNVSLQLGEGDTDATFEEICKANGFPCDRNHKSFTNIPEGTVIKLGALDLAEEPVVSSYRDFNTDVEPEFEFDAPKTPTEQKSGSNVVDDSSASSDVASLMIFDDEEVVVRPSTQPLTEEVSADDIQFKQTLADVQGSAISAQDGEIIPDDLDDIVQGPNNSVVDSSTSRSEYTLAEDGDSKTSEAEQKLTAREQKIQEKKINRLVEKYGPPSEKGYVLTQAVGSPYGELFWGPFGAPPAPQNGGGIDGTFTAELDQDLEASTATPKWRHESYDFNAKVLAAWKEKFMPETPANPVAPDPVETEKDADLLADIDS